MNVKPVFRVILAIAIVAFIDIRHATAQVGTLVALIGTGVTGDHLLNKADEVIRSNINRAQNAGDALISRMASEAGVLEAQLRIGMANNLGTAINAMDEQSQVAFMHLAELVDSFEAAQRRAYTARESTVVDLAFLAGNTLLASQPTFIQSLEGLAQLQADGEYKIVIVASGLRPGVEDQTSSLVFTMGGKQVVPTRIERPGGNRAIAVFSNNTFASHFKPDQIVILPLAIKLEVTRKTFLWFESRKSVEAQIYLSLFPRKAGRITAVATVAQYDWVDVDDVLSDPRDADDCGLGRCNKNPPRYTLTVSVPGGDITRIGGVIQLGNRRIVSLLHNCKPLWGPNACAYPGGHYSVESTDIVANKSRGIVVIKHWTERNRYIAIAKVQELRQVSSKEVRLDQDIFFDQNLEIDLPRDTSFYRLEGTTLTRRRLEVVSGQPNNQIRFISKSSVDADKDRYVFGVSAPELGYAF